MSTLLRTHFDRQLAKLMDSVLVMGGQASQSVASSLRALHDNNIDLAGEVIGGDLITNNMRYEIERHCYSLLAMEQPVAGDMRAIMAALTVTNELERIGDHGKRIAKITQRAANEPRPIPLHGIMQMGESALLMVDRALQTYARQDPEAAREVCAEDDNVDALYKQTFNIILSYMLENTRAIGPGTYLIQIGHELERVADRATNIAERVIYAKTGELMDLNV
jgi:phosphate transport system protein